MIDLFGMKQALYWAHTTADYIIAGGLIALGVYIAMYWQHRFARIVGIMVMGCGIGWGCFAYGKTVGGKDCYEQWAQATKKMLSDAERRDAGIAKLAREFAEKQTAELAKENSELQQKVKDYEVATKNAPACRRATPDDIRRMCAIIGNAAPGCKSTK